MSEPTAGIASGAADPPPDAPPSTLAPATATALELRLSELAADGAGVFDGPGCRMVARLLARARTARPEVGERLCARAAARLDAVEARFEAERARAARALDDCECADPATAARWRAAIDAGDFVGVLRRARRGRAGAAPASRPAPSAGALCAPDPYRDAFADLVFARARAAAADSPPEQPGPLNGSLLATRVLAAADALSPAYRRALVSRFVDVASLLDLAPVASPRRRATAPPERR